MSLRIVHVVRQFYPSVGGMEEVVRTLAQAQRDEYAHDVRVITLNRLFRQNIQLPESAVVDSVPVRRLGYFGSERYPLCLGILKHLRECDVIHVHGIDFFYDFLALTRWQHRRPLIASTHGGFFHTAFAQRMKKIFFNSVTRVSALGYQKIIATSSNDGDLFSRIVNQKRLTVIENGVNIAKFASTASPIKRPVLLYFGRWSANKGLPELFNLFAELRRWDPDWSLIVAGREYDHTTADLLAWGDKLGISEHVSVVPNPDDDCIRDLIRRSTYYVSLSRHEGFGIAPVEAMSAGLIPFLSKIPPHRKLANETSVVKILSEDPIESISIILDEYKKNDSEYQKDKILAKSYAQRFSWSQVIDRYEKEYQLACQTSLRMS